jgi:hypothetical protein
VAAELQHLVAGDDLDQRGDVAPGPERDPGQWDIHAEDRPHLRLGAEAVVVLLLRLAELDDDLDLLVVADRGDAEQVRDVEDPEAADLHVVLMHLEGRAPHRVGRAHRDLDDVVGDQAVALEDQVERGLALADAAAADQQQADAQHVDQHAVDGGARRQQVLELPRQARDEDRAHERAAQHRHAVAARDVHQEVRRVEAAGDRQTAQRLAAERLEARPRLLRRAAEQVVDLGEAEHLDPVGEDVLDEAGQREAGLLDPHTRDLAVELAPVRQQGQLERFGGGVEELADLDRGVSAHDGRSLAGAARRAREPAGARRAAGHVAAAASASFPLGSMRP